MLSIEEFNLKYPGAKCWGSFKEDNYHGSRFIMEGLLQFTPESADRWAGPFEGGHAQFVLRDYSEAVFQSSRDKGKKVLDLWDQGEKERKEKCARNGIKYVRYNDRASKEFPVRLWMVGNDDTSYSKFYRNEREALEEIKLFIANEPLEFYEVIDGFNFVFTN